MKVRLLEFSQRLGLQAGKTVDVSDEEGQRMINENEAEAVKEKPASGGDGDGTGKGKSKSGGK